MRATQDLPHTCSRKGYARLEDEMKKESSNPDSISRIDVWAKGHLKKDGTPSNKTVSETLEKIREYKESVASLQGVGDDALSKVLGPERCGRVRGVGSGVTPSKLGSVSQNKSHVKQLQEEVGTLKEQMARQTELIQKLMEAVEVQQGGNIAYLGTPRLDVTSLSENMVNQCQNSTQVSKVQCVEIEPTQHKSEPQATSNPNQSSSSPQMRENANMRKCKLMNWSVAEELVAIGRWDTDAQDTMVHSVRLGENASRVWVDDVIKGSAPLWRGNSLMETVADAKGTTIVWPNKSIIFDDDN